MRVRASWMAASLLVGGCTATGPAYESEQGRVEAVDQEDTRIVFFRTADSIQYSARKARVSIDAEETGTVAPGGFIYRDLAPGAHRLKVDMWDAPGGCEILVSGARGSIYYFQVDPRQESLLGFAGPAALGEVLGQSMAVSIAAGVGGIAAESYGKECGGAFRLYPVDPDTARTRIAGLRRSD